MNPTPPPADLDLSSIIYLWFSPAWDWAHMGNVTAAGYRAVKTNDWYLDSVGQDWDSGFYTAGACVGDLLPYIHGASL